MTVASNRLFTPGHCYVIAEVAQAHDGSLGLAHAFIDAAAHAGADAVKFQTHIAAAESTPRETWRVPFSRQDASRFDYWRRMEFTPEQWQGLAEHAAQKGVDFLSSPFSLEAARLLERLPMPAWKVASGEVANAPLIDFLLSTGRPMLLSSGLSDWAELDGVVARVRQHGLPFGVMQCTTQYPCPPERVGLNLIQEIRARYGCPAGLSDHSGTVYPGLAAVALGAELLEVHLTMSRAMFGPDVPASLTPDELALLVRGARDIATMNRHPMQKDAMRDDQVALRRLFGHSVVAAGPLAAGTMLTIDALAYKKPGDGIPAEQATALIGRRLRRSLATDEPVAWSDLEDER